MRLAKPVLLLNASYEPLKVIHWKRALNLYFCNKAEILEHYDTIIRSVSLSIYMPSVMRLLNMTRYFRRHIPLTRQNLLLRDGFKCQYCLKNLHPAIATIDHVIPRSKGGDSTWENLVTACPECNKKKGDKTPAEAGMILVAPPKKPVWLPIIKAKDDLPESWKEYIFH